MEKKIGCVICYTKGHNNYGTSLQAYAMLKKIVQLGYQVEVINYIKQLTFLEKVRYVINAFRCGELRHVFRQSVIQKEQKKHPDYAEGLRKRTKAVDSYKQKKIRPFLHDYKGFEKLCSGSLNYDTIVVGSDQVWTPLSLPNKFFNLLFVDDTVRKVAYASSFGVSDIPEFQRKATGDYLNRFSVIGVREQRGKEIVEDLSNKKATVVSDPTLLLTRDEWEEEIKESKVINSDPYIFCYIISDNSEARAKAKELAAKKGLKIVSVRHMEQYRNEDESFGDISPYDMDPNDFVNYIKNASYVCTDSFHCTVFSIIFHKKFMTFYRTQNMSGNSKNSRIDSLIAILGVDKDHIYQGNIEKIDTETDWRLVDENLEKLRTESILFLKNALG